MMKDKDLTRFLFKIEWTNSCWLWTASITHNGYGRFWVLDKMRRAHIVSYTWFIGEILEELELDHLCRNPICVRPDHLEAVTHLENIRRGDIGLYESSKLYCKKGHSYDSENTYRWRNKRQCNICRKLYGLQYRMNRKSCKN